MSTPVADNKRIARNTAMLYFRMLFLTIINLYTVRVTLDLLGVVDYGIYNVVASVVASLGFLTGTLTSATQRYLSFHLGRRDYEAYSRTFSLLLMGFMAISCVIIILGEAVGIFFVDDWLTIPFDRLDAARWVFQTAVFTFVFNLMSVPYTSSLVANERMSAFAYISIVDGVLKLALVFMLMSSPIDRLVYYGVLTMVESAIVFLLYMLYCHRAFTFNRFRFVWDKALFREITAYTGWNLFGSLSGVLNTQGQSVMLNIFFGPVVNAVKAIADKISNVISSFSTNFYMAVSPQVVKSYASGDYARMVSLALKSSRFSFYLIAVLSFPLINDMDMVLRMWLGEGNVDVLMVRFSQLSLVYCLVNSLEQPVTQMIRATGNIRRYQVSVGVFTLMYLPLLAAVLLCGGSALSSMVLLIVLLALVQLIRVRVAHRQVGLSYHEYLYEVAIPVVLVSVLSFAVYFVVASMHIAYGFIPFLAVTSGSVVAETAIVWAVGLKRADRHFIMETIKNKLKNKSVGI